MRALLLRMVRKELSGRRGKSLDKDHQYYGLNHSTHMRGRTEYRSFFYFSFQAFSIFCGVILASFSLQGQQTAYNGPHNVPVLIEAEDFDTGGEGVAYHDGAPGQAAVVSNYRTATDPDVEVEAKANLSNGHIIGYTENGEWYEYTFNVAEAGDYQIDVMTTGRNVGIKGFQLFIDEVRVEIFSDGVFAINMDYIRIAPMVTGDPLSVSTIFQNNAVLQRNALVNVWGKGNPGNEVTISGGWGENTTAIVDANGNWTASLPTGAAGGPYEMTVEDITRSYTYEGLLLGEVWHCFGQSNMAMPLKGWGPENEVTNFQAEIAAADYPEIRLFTVPRQAAFSPATDYAGNWFSATPSAAANRGDFSATAYFFARKIHQELGVPVGVIIGARGNSAVEAWTPPTELATVAGFENLAADLSSSEAGNGPFNLDNLFDDSSLFNTPGVLFNGTVSPLMPYTVAGVNWYQGESNVGEPENYYEFFSKLINGWRRASGNDVLPFHFVQIAPYQNYDNGGNQSWLLREAQLFTNALPNTGIAVLTDAGDRWGIHPENKQDVGLRLALQALGQVYDQDLVYDGPAYKSSNFSDGKAYLDFELQGTALVLGPAGNTFEIAGEDGNFVQADAILEDDKVVLSASTVSTPLMARYGWTNWVLDPPLFNDAGLPASSFMTYNAFILSDEFLINQEMLSITVTGDWNGITVEELTARLRTIPGASFRVVNEAGETITTGQVLSGLTTVICTMDNGQDEKVYSVNAPTTSTSNTAFANLKAYPNPLDSALFIEGLKAGTKVALASSAGKLLVTDQVLGSGPLSLPLTIYRFVSLS